MPSPARRVFGSTWIMPRGVFEIPAAWRSMPSRFGRRPAAIRSRVPVCEVPSARLTRMPPASRWTPWIVTPVWTLMPSLVRRADRKAPASGSSACMIREAISRMVTLLPSRAKACPSSTPTAPLPMITSVSGSSVACTASRFVQKDTVSRPGMGGADGAVPEPARSEVSASPAGPAPMQMMSKLSSIGFSLNLSASAPEREVEDEEHDQCEHRTRRYVPGPGTHQVEQASVLGRLAQIHVVAAGYQVDQPHDDRESEGQQKDARHRTGARIASQADRKEERSDHDRPVGQVELPVRIAREVLAQVGRDQSLQCAPQPPEVAQLHQQPLPPEERGRDDEPRDVTELQR